MGTTHLPISVTEISQALGLVPSVLEVVDKSRFTETYINHRDGSAARPSSERTPERRDSQGKARQIPGG